MYYHLTEALKRRMIHEVRRCFREYYPNHKDIIDFVQPKYSFSSRPQKGITVSITGANPQQLSADNFQGTVISHVMLSQVEDYPGHIVEWAKEDTFALKNHDIGFPSPPGIYYLDIFSHDAFKSTVSQDEYDQTIEREGQKDFYFYVDPLLTAKNEPVKEVGSENVKDTSAYLINADIVDGSLDLYDDRHQLVSAPYLTLSSDRSLEIVDNGSQIGLESGHVAVKTVSSNDEPFDIPVDQNTFSVAINGSQIDFTVSPGFRYADEVIDEIQDQLYDSDIPFDAYTLSTDDGSISIEATESLRILSNPLNDVFGFSEGYISPALTGNIFRPHLEEAVDFKIGVDGEQFTIPLFQGDTTASDLANRLEQETRGLSVSHSVGGDYRVDHTSGEITFLRDFREGTKITASYKYPVESRGAFGIDQKRSNNKAIPGVVLAFGTRDRDRDKSAVVVHDELKPVAAEYGGRWDLDVDLDLITRDHTTRAEITDALLMYFFSLRKSELSEEGIEITDVSSGGESEEMYQDSEGLVYYRGSVSLSVRTDWAIHVPKPLTIERVSPSSHLGSAGLPDEDVGEQSGVEESSLVTLDRSSDLYFVGRTHEFERIK